MREELELYKKGIKKKHKFSFWDTPEYAEEIDFQIESNLFESIVQNVIDSLEWKLIKTEKNLVVAESNEKWKTHGIIEISLFEGKTLSVKSKTMFDQRWDNGQNSIRVKLFLKALFDEYESISDEQKKFTGNFSRRNYRFIDYEYPVKLPPEVELGTGKVLYPMIAGICTSLFFGFFSGYLISKGFFIGGVRELIFGLTLWFVVTTVAKTNNFLNSKVLIRISLLSIFTLFLFGETSNYFLITESYSLGSFLNHWKEMFSHIFSRITLSNIPKLLVLLSGFFLFYFVFKESLSSRIYNIKNGKIPFEVKEFVEYLVSEGKNEEQIRNELRKFGWTSKEAQDFLIEEKLIYRFDN
ncbi:MAG: hypothetical protein ABJ387_05490 [Balneola sp.]